MARSGKSPQPPLLFLGCLLAAWGMDRFHPLGLGLPEAPRLGGGALLLMMAAGLGAWGLATFRRHGTTHEPNGRATRLLTGGPFAFSRNPLYLGLVILQAAFGLLLDSAWGLILAAGLALLLDRLVVAREEVRLRAQFGAAYEAYARRVRRWI